MTRLPVTFSQGSACGALARTQPNQSNIYGVIIYSGLFVPRRLLCMASTWMNPRVALDCQPQNYTQYRFRGLLLVLMDTYVDITC